MYHKLISLIFGLLCFYINNYCYDQQVYLGAVTYDFNGGRFGDNLLSYIHAEYVAYKYKIPLLYKPFSHSEYLKLHTQKLLYNGLEAAHFSKIITISESKQLSSKPDPETLYIIPFFTETSNEFNNWQRHGCLFSVDWYDQNFISIIRQMISPNFDMPTINVPPGYLSVVVHVRKGSGQDYLLADEPGRIPRPGIRYSDVFLPLKHLPDEYYIEEIRRLYFLHNKQPLYVYILCDRNTQKVVEYYKQQLHDIKLIIEGNKWGKSDPENPIFDFFLMLQFDCLIRSESNLSLVASKIGNFLTIVSPAGFYRIDDEAPIQTLWPSFITRNNIKDTRL